MNAARSCHDVEMAKHPLTWHPVASVAAALALALGGCSTQAPSMSAQSPQSAQLSPADSASLDASIAGPQRADKARARDAYRHPKETLAFFDVQPTQTVLEIAPGGGWYTDVLAPYLRGQGHLYEAQYLSTLPELAEEDRDTDAAFNRKIAGAPGVYGNLVVGTLHAGQFSGFDAQGRFDCVLTFRNIHNWLKDGQLDANLRAFHAALKPGGVLGVEEHRAPPGTSVQQMIDTGYMTQAYVIERVQAAGFVLDATSEINANPRDTKDYPHGVWSLPPTYKGGDADRARYAAIGESDRMTLRFVKR
jgi:predicted methyltransferase